ncbi:hypothetical protein HHI36_010383 [Cryptolaemus montrouzieri]|uniref:Uncharacterized protein n=1 Tax=Cryptolaemus montrouzieri TaxID=559131 RepID=A0ABD2MIS7_9CUCU
MCVSGTLVTQQPTSIEELGIDFCSSLQKCKEFYIEAAKQILKRFPFDHKDRQALKCLKMLNPEAFLDPEIKKKFPSIADLYYFFRKICPNNITELDREWRMLRNVDLSFVQNRIPDIIDFWKHVHEKWRRISNIPHIM